MTSTERITGVSRLPSRPRSASTLAITPDDETQVMPASTSAGDPAPAEQQREAGAGQRVEQRVDQPGRARRSAGCRPVRWPCTPGRA